MRTAHAVISVYDKANQKYLVGTLQLDTNVLKAFIDIPPPLTSPLGPIYEKAKEEAEARNRVIEKQQAAKTRLSKTRKSDKSAEIEIEVELI